MASASQRSCDRVVSGVLLTVVAWSSLVACGQSDMAIASLATDRGRHEPGSVAVIAASVINRGNQDFDGQFVVTWRRLGVVCHRVDQSVHVAAKQSKTITIDWTIPADDFVGYGIDADLLAGDAVAAKASTALDASSSWRRFPRYGFVTDYDARLTQDEIIRRTALMTRLHLSAIQFYDWMEAHDEPVPRGFDGVDVRWRDWAGREIDSRVLRQRIDSVRAHGMHAMAYALVYGAAALPDGQGPRRPEWAAYREPNQTAAATVSAHPENTEQPILHVMDMSNQAWRNHLLDRLDTSTMLLGFDGLHLDYLGPGKRYPRGGDIAIDEKAALPAFVAATRTRNPERQLAVNDVAGHLCRELANSEADIYYTEVWGRETYQALRDTILDAKKASSSPGRAVVLAAYVQKREPPAEGWISDAAARLLDAAIFANGGYHLEMGEGDEMLTNEYFPNRKLRIRPSLRESMPSCYDVLVRCQNALSFAPYGQVVDRTPEADISSPSHELNKNAQSESIWTVAKSVAGHHDAVSLINLNGVDTEWRNASDPPITQQHVSLRYRPTLTVKSVSAFTPDDGLGRPLSLPFETAMDGSITFVVPRLEYWTVLVFEGSSP
jgi:dextranase